MRKAGEASVLATSLSMGPPDLPLYHSLRTRPVTPATPNVISNHPTPMWIQRYVRKNLLLITQVAGRAAGSEVASPASASLDG